MKEPIVFEPDSELLKDYDVVKFTDSPWGVQDLTTKGWVVIAIFKLKGVPQMPFTEETEVKLHTLLGRPKMKEDADPLDRIAQLEAEIARLKQSQ